MTNVLAIVLLVLGADSTPKTETWEVDGVKREAVVYYPAKSKKASPVVFGYHGHGGNPTNAARSFRLHQVMPEAIVVYPKGLPTATKNDPKGERSGWQPIPGVEKDRDFKFFDAMLAWLKKEHQIDDNRVYVTGHSNGGGFTYSLWAQRGEQLTAVAPSAAGGGRLLTDKSPKLPCLHLAGEKDTVVDIETQRRTIELAKKHNGCESTGKEWSKGCTIFSGPSGAVFVTYMHDGTHAYPATGPELIAKFFREQVRK